MNIKLIFSFFVLVFISSCADDKKQNRYTSYSSGQVFISCKASFSALLSLTFSIESIAFIDDSENIHTVKPNEKRLDLALSDPQFIAAFHLPEGQYTKVIINYDLKNSQASLFDRTASNLSSPFKWIYLQLIDHRGLLIPEETNKLHQQIILQSPLRITREASHFFNFDFFMDENVYPSILGGETYLTFHPTVKINQASDFVIEGRISGLDNGRLTMIVDDSFFEIEPDQWRIDGELVKGSGKSSGVEGQSVRISIAPDDDEGHFVDANIITGNYYKGMVVRKEEKIAFLGHKYRVEKGVDFYPYIEFSNDPLDDVSNLPIGKLKPGQVIEVYLTEGSENAQEGDQFFLNDVEMLAEVVLETATELRIAPISIQGKDAKAFYSGTLRVNPVPAVLGQSGSRKLHRLQGSQQSIFRAILPLKKEKTA